MADETQINEEQSNLGKVEKEFNEHVGGISAILNKPLPRKKGGKVGSAALNKVAEKLIIKQEESLLAEVESELEVLIEGHIKVYQEKAAKQKELDKAVEAAMKEFSDKAKKLFAKIEGLPEIRKNYEAALAAGGAPSV